MTVSGLAQWCSIRKTAGFTLLAPSRMDPQSDGFSCVTTCVRPISRSHGKFFTRVGSGSGGDFNGESQCGPRRGRCPGRFPLLRSIRKIITENPATLQDILLMVDACVIIHNFLVKRGLSQEDEDMIVDDDNSLIDDYDRLPAGDELNQAIPEGGPNDLRRTQLLYYLKVEGVI